MAEPTLRQQIERTRSSPAAELKQLLQQAKRSGLKGLADVAEASDESAKSWELWDAVTAFRRHIEYLAGVLSDRQVWDNLDGVRGTVVAILGYAYLSRTLGHLARAHAALRADHVGNAPPVPRATAERIARIEQQLKTVAVFRLNLPHCADKEATHIDELLQAAEGLLHAPAQ